MVDVDKFKGRKLSDRELKDEVRKAKRAVREVEKDVQKWKKEIGIK